MGCFFVGRVAEGELIGAGKQWGGWQRFHFVEIAGAFILIVYNSWNKDEITVGH